MQVQKSYKETAYGNLYLVPTPIGNLGDTSQRILDTLNEVDLIASEDTRNTQKLLNHFGIQKAQKSLHEHNFKERIPQLLELLKSGQSIAQVSDAGMPSISDPGHELVLACIEENIHVIALPGPTAGLTALIASGLTPQPHYFHGFLPRKKKEQLTTLATLQQLSATMIFYESPYRLKATLANFVEVFGADRQVVVCRELTKIHEEYLRGSLQEVLTYCSENEIKGECCLLLAGASTNIQTLEIAQLTDEQLIQMIDTLIAKGDKPNAAIKEVAKQVGMKKQELYQLYHREK